jgi:chemotaxis signal transduction protein
MDRMQTNLPNPGEMMEPIHIVIFRLFQQILALPIEPIFEIVEMVTILPLPKPEAPIEGVINVHGKMVPVVDLHRLLLQKKLTLRTAHSHYPGQV